MRQHTQHAALKESRQHRRVLIDRITVGPQFLQDLALARGVVLGIFGDVVSHYHRSTLTNPLLIASVAADVRSETPIFPKRFCTCVLTVFSLISSAKPISLLDMPPTI